VLTTRLVVLACLVPGLVVAARSAHAQHEHHHGSGQTPAHDPHAHHDGDVEAGVAVEGAALEGGSFQGIAPTLAWTPGRFGARVVVPAYHLEHGGDDAVGLGDVIVTGHLRVLGGEGWATGVIVAAGLPTGDADDGLGMGHVMVMPSAFLAAQRGRGSLTAHLGAGKSLGEPGEHAHAMHGAAPGSLVAPMNAFELGGSLRAGLQVARALGVHATGGIAVPVGDGETRATGGGGARWRVRDADVGIEVHLPLIGDPFRVRAVADLAYRF